MSTGVEKVDADSVLLSDGERIPAKTIVWTAGVRASPLLAMLDGVERDRNGRVVVLPDLTVPGHPELLVVGDAAAVADRSGGTLPGVAQVAIQGGRHAARTIVAQLAGRPSEPFHYFDKGTMATIGRHDGVAQLPGGMRLTGPIGWLAWLGLHILYLIGFRNRANVLVNWAWNYLTYDRGSRHHRRARRRRSERPLEAHHTPACVTLAAAAGVWQHRLRRRTEEL